MSSFADLAELVRAPAALSVPGDVIAGAGASRSLGPATGGLATAAVCLYWAGMAANDWADRVRDASERPDRPIPSGRVRPGTALGVAAGLTAAGLACAGAAGGRRSLAVALPLAAAVWGYDLGGKETPAGPALMATCRGLDVLLGASTQKGGPARALPTAVTVALHTYALTVLSRAEVTGATPRLPAGTLAGTAAVAVAAVAIPRRAAAGESTSSRRWATGVAGLLAGAYLSQFGTAQARAVRDPGATRVRAAVSSGITSLPSLQGALAARAGFPRAALLVAALAPLGRRLARWISPT
ncbi:SCO3242 family prenyltransferase [Pilimelia columellifera]|uniref:UbiA family prenyltransferase n=1 Tax=Pilimelia columellifera subsp. columellifera TaxID=706583 RepID=A0ABP6B1X5_9ACTN